MERKEKGRKKGRKESSFPSPEWLPPYLLGKERNPPEPQCFQGIRRKKEREKGRRKGWPVDKIFKKGFMGKRMEEMIEKERKECSFSVFQGGFSLSRKRKKSSGFKGRRRERRKRKKMRCLAWRMGYLGAG